MSPEESFRRLTAGDIRTADIEVLRDRYVVLTSPVYHDTRKTNVQAGTEGRVLGVRREGDGSASVLVKWDGFTWPKAVPVRIVRLA